MTKRLFSAAFIVGFMGAIPAHAQVQMIADYDNQLLATGPATAGLTTFWHSVVNTTSSGQNMNVGRWDDLTQVTGGTTATNNISRIAGLAAPTTGPVPAGNGDDNAYELRWGFIGTGVGTNRNADPDQTFLRCFSGTGNRLVNPVLDLAKPLSFDIWTKEPVRLALVISEGDQSGRLVGASGVGGAPLECVGGPAGGADQITASKALGGWVLPAGQWVTITIDWANPLTYSTRPAGFAGLGNGTIAGHANSPTVIGLGSFCFTPIAGTGGDLVSHEVYIDNVRIGSDAPNGINGKITLESYLGDVTQVPIDIVIKDGENNDVQTETINLEADGSFSFPTTLPDGTYRLLAKASHWLKRSVADVAISGGGVTIDPFSLINGDIDGDNNVGLLDYDAFSLAYDSFPGAENWNPEADLDGSDDVTLLDYDIFSENFDKAGDE